MLIAATPKGGDRVFSEKMACARLRLSFPELTPQSFSFNSPQGMCVDCNGLGTRVEIDPRARGARRVALARRGRGQAVGPGRLGEDRLGARLPRPDLRAARHRHAAPLAASSRSSSATGCCTAPASARFKVKWAGKSGRGDLRDDLGGRAAAPDAPLPETSSEGAKRWYAQFLGDAPCSHLRRHAPARRERRRARRRAHARRGLGAHRRRGARVLRRRSRSTGAAREIAAEVLQGDPRPARLPRRGRPRLPLARPRRAVALGRRVAAHPAREPGRLRADRRDLHPRRALDRPAPARQPAAARDARAPARHRQHRGRRRARRGDDPRRRPRDRLRPRRGRAGRPDRARGHAGEPRALRGRRSPARISPGRARDPGPGASGAHAERQPQGRSARARTTCATSTSSFRSACWSP